jgi:hypothetical protein
MNVVAGGFTMRYLTPREPWGKHPSCRARNQGDITKFDLPADGNEPAEVVAADFGDGGFG